MRSFIEEKLQKLLNHALSLDPESKKRLAALDGKTVAIELNMLDGINFQLHFTHDGVELKSRNTDEAHTVIKGTPLSLLHLSLSSKNRKQFFAEDVSIEGNIELGQQVIALFDELEIDWEEYLSQWVGDVPAHHMGNVAKKIRTFSNHLRETLFQHINEYTHEEIHLFPPPEALQDFFHDVDVLRMDVDRLTARIQQLIQSIDKEA